MRIALIGTKTLPAREDGLGKYAEEVSERLVRLGKDVFLYSESTYSSKKIVLYKGARMVYVPKIFPNFFASLHAAFSGYDIIHYQSQAAANFAWIPKFFSWQTGIVTNLKQMGVDVLHTKKTEALSKWNLRQKRYAIFQGKLTKKSGAHILIEVFKYLENTAKTPSNFKLVIMGDVDFSDDYVKYLQTISKGRGNIIFTGEQDDRTKHQLLANAFLFINPAETKESCSNMIEAMGHKLAILTTNSKKNIETVGEGGYFFNSKSMDDFKKRLAYVLNRPEEVRQTAILARKRVQKKYGWDSVVEKILEVYNQSLLEKRNGQHRIITIQ